MSERSRGWWIPVVLVTGVLLPYTPMLVGASLPFSDDFFISDLLDGEFPARVEAARLIRSGEGSTWTPLLFGGLPSGADPLSLLLFLTLPPALALGWLIGLFLVAASLGTYALARKYEASAAGAALAGFAFAWSGFFVCQLRHLGVLGTVCLFPVALWCLEHVARPGDGSPDDGTNGQRGHTVLAVWTRRAPWAMAFALVFGVQITFGFPQSVYACALVYGAVAAVRLVQLQWRRREETSSWEGRVVRPKAVAFAVQSSLAVVLGAGIGMLALLPLGELGAISDRAEAGTYEWATRFNYWPPNVLTFFVPYAWGDISNLTYVGTSVFWEDHGYVGWMTVLLAALAVGVAARRGQVREVGLWVAIGLVAFLIVLGKHTPVYGWAFDFLPGMGRFRMPTRFLFVVELALVLVAAQGVTWLQASIVDRLQARRPALVASMLAWAISGWTAIDLVWINARQNAWVDARAWLASPHTADVIRADALTGRVHTPGNSQLRGEVPYATRGWSGDLTRYVEYREFLPPNSNLLHGVSTVDGYSGIAPRWCVDLVGDHNRPGMLNFLFRYDRGVYSMHPQAMGFMEAIGIRWLLLVADVPHERLEQVGRSGPLQIYRLRHTLPRARLVGQGRHIAESGDVLREIMAGKLDLRREVVIQESGDAELAADLLVDEAAAAAAPMGGTGQATIARDENDLVVVDVEATRPSFLLLADTYYPGWTATLDGAPVPILRANVAHRAVLVPEGSHQVVFRFRSLSAARGLLLSSISLAVVLLIWIVAALANLRLAASSGASLAGRGSGSDALP